jgi:hypothetical protein
MTMTGPRVLTIALACAAVFGGLFWSGPFTPAGHRSALVTEAGAIIGRPLTPVSVAGVARRTTRREIAIR